MEKLKKDKSEGSAELKAVEGSLGETVASNAERSKILSPLCGSTILDQHSARHPKVFIKMFNRLAEFLFMLENYRRGVRHEG